MKTIIEIKINKDIYNKEILLKTIEILSSRFYCEFDKEDQYFIIKVSEKYPLGFSDEKIKDIFFDNLNNQIIRTKIFEETKDIRNLIVGKALFETEAFDEQSDYFNMSKYDDKDNYILDLNNIAKF